MAPSSPLSAPARIMRAVVFKSPGVVALEQRPIPSLRAPTDALVRVSRTALCGSELHVFRGHQPSGVDFVMGHEFTGTVEAVGDEVKGVRPGDEVVAPFTVSCGECFFCANGYSSRCEKGALFGSPALDGAQAEYVRVPLADATLVKAPEGIPRELLVLMADIFPTGYFAALNAFKELTPAQVAESTVLLIGCGPVGLCALINILQHRPKHVIAVDQVDSRLELARGLGVEVFNNKGKGPREVAAKLREVSGKDAADVAVEVVGLSPALRVAFDAIRPWGIISSVGVHNGEIPWTGNEAYGKNLRIQMGRCPVRSIFEPALEQLKKNHHLLGFMTDKIMPMTEAIEGYRLFDQMEVQKVVFKAGE